MCGNWERETREREGGSNFIFHNDIDINFLEGENIG